MADCDWLRDEPHSFGVCEERNFTARVKSYAWKEEEQRVTIIGRREGDEFKIYIPNILRPCKTGVEVQCGIAIDLSEYIDLFLDLKCTFTSTMMFYDENLQTSIVIPAVAKLQQVENKTFLGILPVKGTLPNENRFTANNEIQFGVMNTTITLNLNLFDMLLDNDDDDDDEDMSDGEDEPVDVEGKYEGDYIGFVPKSESEISTLKSRFAIGQLWNCKVIRCLAKC